MYAGRFVEEGTVDHVFHRPRMPYTAGLLGSVPSLDQRRPVSSIPIQGAPPSLIQPPAGCKFAARCPLVAPECLTSEPPLFDTDDPAHRSACHRGRRSPPTDPVMLFRDMFRKGPDAGTDDGALVDGETPADGAS